jgi:hypothetical protein
MMALPLAANLSVLAGQAYARPVNPHSASAAVEAINTVRRRAAASVCVGCMVVFLLVTGGVDVNFLRTDGG